MRTPAILLTVLCGLAAGPAVQAFPAAAAASVQVQEADRNAALDYWRLITLEHGGDDLFEQAGLTLRLMHPGEDAEEPPADEPAALKPGAELAGALADLDSYFDDVERASRTPSCDFQIRYEDGYAVLMPHLSPLRKIGRLMVADARRMALEGDFAGAAERLAATLRLARHMTGDRTLISSLVSVAISDQAMKEGLWLLERSQNAPAVREALVAGVGRFPHDDPYFVEGALRVERDMIGLLARQFSGPKAGQDFLDAFATSLSPETDEPARAIAAMNAQQFKAETERGVDAFDLILEAWRSDYPAKGLGEIELRCVEGEFGAVAQVVVPALSNAQARDAKARENLEAFRARVNGNG